jgi:NAD(P)-dependent dehydrogenase (short-subunit alcohol dehydrogenase family)
MKHTDSSTFAKEKKRAAAGMLRVAGTTPASSPMRILCVVPLIIVSMTSALAPRQERFDASGLLIDSNFPMPDTARQIRSGLAIVTGAGGLIGSEIALGLASHGLSLIVPCRPGSMGRYNNTLTQLWKAHNLQSKGVSFTLVPVDLGVVEQVDQFVKRVKRLYAGRVRVLINNAAVSQNPASSAGAFPSTLLVNVWTPWTLCVRLLSVLRTSGGPTSIVNVASVLAFGIPPTALALPPTPRTPKWDYPQTKTALRMLTWEMDRRFGPEARAASATEGDIYFNAVHPGVALSKLSRESYVVKLICRKGECQSPELLAARTVWLAINAPALDISGRWFEMNGETDTSEELSQKFGDRSLWAAMWAYMEALDKSLCMSPCGDA